MIFAQSSFGRNLNILEKSMDANRLRANVIADNLVNSQVPNFKRSEVNFESQLRRALEAEKVQDKLLKVNHVETRKVQFMQMQTPDKVQPMVRLDYLSEVKQNGNNVDVDRESAEAKKNAMTFDLLAELVRFQFNQVATAIR